MDIPKGSLRFGPVGFLDDFLRLPIVCSERVRRVARDKVALFASWAFPLSVTENVSVTALYGHQLCSGSTAIASP